MKKLKWIIPLCIAAIIVGVIVYTQHSQSDDHWWTWQRCYAYQDVTVAGVIDQVTWDGGKTTILYHDFNVTSEPNSYDWQYTIEIPWRTNAIPGDSFNATKEYKLQVPCLDGEPVKHWTTAVVISKQVTGFKCWGNRTIELLEVK